MNSNNARKMNEDYVVIMDDLKDNMINGKVVECEAHYETIAPHNLLDPYDNLGPVAPGCVVMDEYVGHGDDIYPATVVLEPIHPSFRDRIDYAWAAIKAVFA